MSYFRLMLFAFSESGLSAPLEKNIVIIFVTFQKLREKNFRNVLRSIEE
jgi:hypothetical protein